MRFPSPLPAIAGLDQNQPKQKIALEHFAREPFRVFFPAATLTGMVGVSLWPLHLLGATSAYPGQAHAQVMAHGLFGGFIFGFLGTAMPRMLSARPLRIFEMLPLLLVYLSMVVTCALGQLQVANVLFVALLGSFVTVMAPRFAQRKDLPPPGFALVAMSLGCAGAGALLAAFLGVEPDPYWITIQRLLTYQGFVLLPILGIGPFILPRFFGLQSPHDLPEALKPTPAWSRKAFLAVAAGLAIIGSFFVEASGHIRVAYSIRFVATAGYMMIEMPLRKGPQPTNVFGMAIRVSLVGIVLGFLAVALFPAYRVGLLHVTLVGGFAVITFVVATRVLFGHSGNIAKLKARNRWFLVAIALMLFGMATRISGDFWPKIMASHYIYGAILWVAGVIIWAAYTLPSVLTLDSE